MNQSEGDRNQWEGKIRFKKRKKPYPPPAAEKTGCPIYPGCDKYAFGLCFRLLGPCPYIGPKR
jgi:hypothetical protein